MKAFIFDTETTGLIDNHVLPLDKQPEIIEVYGCLYDLKAGKIIREIDALVKPKRGIPEENVKITGITEADVKKAPIWKDVFPKFIATMKGAEAVIGHNLSYDIEMTEIECERIGEKVDWPAKRICTVEQTVYLKGYRLSLTALHQLLFNEGFPEAHRAKNDVMALARCARELFNRGDI